MKKLITSVCLIAALSIQGCTKPDQTLTDVDNFIAAQNIDKTKSDWKTSLPKPEQFSFSSNKQYYWHLTTNHGEIVIELFHDIAPMHVSSTLYLTRLGFYDGLTFHRIIPNFMAQGGDPLGNGRGNPGYYYAGEFALEHEKSRHHKAGILSMANRGPNTDGSQFFITFTATPHLDGRHTVFGQVTQGLDDVLKKIEALGSSPFGKTSEEVKILKASISVKTQA